LRVGHQPFVVKGATYGSFQVGEEGTPFPPLAQVDADFRAMAGAGLNTVRLYDVPSSAMLDLAGRHGLRVLVGLQYPDWRMEAAVDRRAGRRVLDAGRRAVDEAMDVLVGRREVLAVSVGNEVPGDLVRVRGSHHVESVLGELVDRVHAADPGLLVTYTNYPTTEYLEVPRVDLVTFNVFLEQRAAFVRYLAHLLALSAPKPLLLTEVGLAAELHGELAQRSSLAWQLEEVERSGCAGAAVFSWTDEWSVGGEPVEGWGFGITDVARRPKPALQAVTRWARTSVADLEAEWPRVSVVVCAYNERRTIGECLESLARCDYPDLEVLVCDDGSTDETLSIAESFPFRVLALPHGGLSRARNAGIEAATGEIVAFLDADAACHPSWPWHLAISLGDPEVVATGGPNLPFADAGLVERAVNLSPGSPTEVLVGDDRAEHVPGCNMAFRRADLRAIGGFDPIYTSAGDDVDVCWKLLDRGRAIAFTPAAQVRHHRRGTVKGYLRQQRGYGRAEKLLSGHHPERFNRLGQARWSGFIYGGVGLLPQVLRPVVYHGDLGLAPFQTVSRRPTTTAAAWGTALVPLAAPLAVAGLALAVVWPQALALTALAIAALLGFGLAIAASVVPDRSEPQPWRLRALVGLLHVAQPFWRTWGRLTAERPARDVAPPVWTGDRAAWLASLRQAFHAAGLGVRSGGPHDRWDFRLSVGPFVRCTICVGVAWHWVPHLRTRVRPSRAVYPLAALWLLLLRAAPIEAAVVLVAVLAIAALEALALQQRVGRACGYTTAEVSA
jgi:glycosyltransferase involved in cell wall biosynthesis